MTEDASDLAPATSPSPDVRSSAEASTDSGM